MKVQQLFYTSCKKGISSGMGFQTYSMSEGITEEERKEIESHCIYIPPDNLPTQPTKEEIEKLFPVALSSFKLKSGKYCICHSKYIGKDYSGRYGNYFSHVLICDNMWPFYPIELYGSITFKDCLTFEEENATEIKPLPNLEEIHLGNVIDFYTISKFLKGIENRRKNFKLLMDNVIGYEKQGKDIVFWDSKENNPYWIGAIQMALPKNLAQTFSFTTYCYNPENTNYIISALDKDGSAFTSKGNQKLYKYTSINFNENNQQMGSTNFSKLVEVGYTVSKEVLLSFLSFVEQFEYNQLDEDIEDCICLYNIVNKGIERLNIKNIKKAITFANTYKSQHAFSKLFEQIDPNLEKISTQVDIELTEVVTKFLFNMGRETKKYEHIQKAYDFFFDATHCLVVDEKNVEVEIEDILKLYKKIRDNEKESSHEFIKMCLDKNRIEELNTYFEGGKVRHAKFYLKSMIEDIIIFNKECDITEKIQLFTLSNEEDLNRANLFKKCMEILLSYPKDLEAVIYYFKDECEYVSNIIIMEYIINLHKGKSTSIQEVLAKFVITEGEKDLYWKKKVYSNIYSQPYGMDFMFDIFKYELSKNIGNRNFFIGYCEEIFDEFTEYRNKKFWQGVETYINFFEDISLEEYKKILDYICKNSPYLEVNKKVLQRLIVNFEEKIKIEDAGGLCENIDEIEKLKNKYKINTYCSITELICIYKKLKDDSYQNKMKAIRNFKADFSHMSPDKYEEYLSWILSNLGMYIRDYVDHAKIQRAFLCEEYEEIYYKIYTDIILNILYEKKYKNMLKDCNIEAHEIFLDYVVFILRGKVEFKENIQQYVEDKIIYVLQNSSERKINNYDQYIFTKIEDDRNEDAILKEWEKIKIKSAEKGGFKNILSFFKK